MRGHNPLSLEVNPKHWLGVLFLALIGSATGGCGHPASEQECEEIIERMLRLEAEQRKREGASINVSEKVAQAKKDLTKECVGKRITDSAVECVRKAKTAEEIRSKCFD